jgi:hypothetical protein
MSISVTIKSELSRKLRQIPGIVANEARVTIKEGLGKIRTRSSVVHKYTPKSGNADKAYVQTQPTDFMGVLALDKYISNAPYVFYLHEGTKSHMVRPKHKKALAWNGNFSKGHMVSGIKAMKFLYNAKKYYQHEIFENLKKVPKRAIKKAGL